MTWKVERWLSEVFPGKEQIYAEYRALPARELAIVAAAVLDVALAELLALRLVDEGNEAEEFLGLNGDGRAPAGSFGARIQLGLLVGLLEPNDVAVLRAIKELRNVFAHRVRVTFISPPVLKITKRLHALWVKRVDALIQSGELSGSTSRMVEVQRFLPSIPQAGEGLLLAVLSFYQAYFHRMHNHVERLGDAINLGKDKGSV